METIYAAISRQVREAVNEHTWRGFAGLTGVPTSILQRIAKSEEGVKHTELQTILKLFPRATWSLNGTATVEDLLNPGRKLAATERETGREISCAEMLEKLDKAVRDSDVIRDKLEVLGLLLRAALGTL